MSQSFHLDKYLALKSFLRGRAGRAVAAGDACRARHDWLKAAAHYQRALRIEPSRRPIWVQLGHALKEAGDLDGGLKAYRKASAIPGEDGDAPLHLGMLAQRLGDMPAAKAGFLQALRENPENSDACRELLDIHHNPLAISDAARHVALTLNLEEADRFHAAPPRADRPLVVYDASDLVSYFRHSRLPTGIQRVQMEVICSTLNEDPHTQICCFANDRGHWIRIPAQHFRRTCTLAVADGNLLDPQWLEAIEVLTAAIDLGDPVEFSQGAFLVNLGTSWWLQNYFLCVRAAQRSHGIHYVPFVHDFIPVMTPQHCVKELTQDFLSWTFGVFHHAEFFFVNSQSTKNDLLKVADILGYSVTEDQVAVIPLDADFRRSGHKPLPPTTLACWELEAERYVLFVSTIESRKNHLLAFHAWLDLIQRHGVDAAPILVCVGNRGWLNDRVYALLDEQPLLASKVRMLSRLSDDVLDLLYRNCCFTLYPSSYEGWGLPVTESLCYGKVPLLTHSSSLPEAGGGFAVYVELNDRAGLVSALERLWFDAAARRGLEERIRRDFRPRKWRDVANQIVARLGNFIQHAGQSQTPPPTIAFNTFYRFARNQQTHLVRDDHNGEQLRFATGWWQLENWGCWTKPEGGELLFQVPNGVSDVYCYLRLISPLDHGTQATLTLAGAQFGVSLLPREKRWISLEAKVVEGMVRLKLKGDTVVDMSRKSHFRDSRRIAIGLTGLVVTPRIGDRLTMPDIARLIGQTSQGGYSFLRDIYPLLLDQEVDQRGLEDYLLALEAGALSRDDVVDILSQERPTQAFEHHAFDAGLHT